MSDSSIDHLSVCLMHLISNARRSRNQIQIIFPFQTFLNKSPDEEVPEIHSGNRIRNAMDVSGSNCRAASFNCNFSSASRRSGIFCSVCRIHPAVHHRIDLLYPGNGSAHGFSAFVTVSPTRVSFTFFRLAVKYPTIPALNSSHGINCPAPRIADFYNLCLCSRCHHQDRCAFSYRSLH